MVYEQGGHAYLTDQRFFDLVAPQARPSSSGSTSKARIHNCAVMSTRGEHLVRADRRLRPAGDSRPPCRAGAVQIAARDRPAAGERGH